MRLEVKEINKIMVVIIQDNIMQEFVAVFRSRLSELIEEGKTRIVLDMADSSYISSLCLAVIVDAKNRTTAAGGDLKIARTNKLIRNLMEITNLNKKIGLYETLEEAIASFTIAADKE